MHGKNNKTNDSKNKSVKDSLVDLKNEVKYINKSLKEIENTKNNEYKYISKLNKDAVLEMIKNKVDEG